MTEKTAFKPWPLSSCQYFRCACFLIQTLNFQIIRNQARFGNIAETSFEPQSTQATVLSLTIQCTLIRLEKEVVDVIAAQC